MSKQTLQSNLHWVYESIINWGELFKDKEALKKVLTKGSNTFYFLRGKISSDNVHSYLGFYNDNIYLHFVPSSFDKEAYFLNHLEIPSQMYSCLASNDQTFIGGPIETDDALKRIQNWENSELRNKALDINELYQAFFIPNDNFTDNLPLKIKFALIDNRPDLVIEQIGKSNSFFDTCRPVPPFPPEVSENNFALLSAIKRWNNA